MIMKTFRPERRDPIPADGILRSTWTVGRRTVTVVQDVSIVSGAIGQLRAEWEPDQPRKLSKREWREYRTGRDAHCSGSPTSSAAPSPAPSCEGYVSREIKEASDVG
jgi:hypothetical protein